MEGHGPVCAAITHAFALFCAQRRSAVELTKISAAVMGRVEDGEGGHTLDMVGKVGNESTVGTVRKEAPLPAKVVGPWEALHRTDGTSSQWSEVGGEERDVPLPPVRVVVDPNRFVGLDIAAGHIEVVTGAVLSLDLLDVDPDGVFALEDKEDGRPIPERREEHQTVRVTWVGNNPSFRHEKPPKERMERSSRSGLVHLAMYFIIIINFI